MTEKSFTGTLSLNKTKVCVCAFACVRACVRSYVCVCSECFNIGLFESHHEKTGFWHMRKQRRRSVLR